MNGFRSDGFQLNQLIHRERNAGKFTDGKYRTNEGDRGNDGIDTGAILQTGIHIGAGFIHPSAERGDDTFDDAHDMLIIFKRNRQALDFTASFHINVARAVDHDFCYRIIIQ